MSDSSWIRNTRIRQGLKGFQLAERLQVSAARVSVLEKDEKRGAVTLKMMDRAARAMGCRFEYRIISQTEGAENLPQGRKPRYRLVVDDSEQEQSKTKSEKLKKKDKRRICGQQV